MLSALFLVLDGVGTFKLCGGIEYGECMDYLHSFLGFFIPILPVFALSIIAYFLREEVFRAWMKFVYWWIPLTMFMILISPEYGQELMPVEKGTVAVFFSGIFIIVSLIIMIIKSRSKEI